MRTDSQNIPTRASHGGAVGPGVELDFSTNLNPVPRPKELDAAIRASLDDVGVYPDYRQTAAREAIARLEGVRPSNVFGGNGASELFTALANALEPRRSLVVEPSFIGLRRALEASSVRRVEPFYLREDDGFELTDALLPAIAPGVDLVSLADPNNPTGRNIDAALLDAILERCEATGAALAVDESFLRLSKKRAGLAQRAADASNLYVVSSFTKSCVIPGLRVGYLVSNEENVRRVAAAAPEWNMSGPAQRAAVACAEALGATEFAEETRSTVARESAFLSDRLRALGICVFASDTNFLLLRCDKDLYRIAAENKILIRDCSNFDGLRKGYYRVAVKNRRENEALIAAFENGLRSVSYGI